MKKILLSILAMFLIANVYSQTTEKAVKQYGFWDNWFIQAQIGASENFSENYKKASVWDVLSPSAAIGLGKYFSPEVGARIQFNGWESKTYLPIIDDTYSTKSIGVNFDALFDLTNIFSKYNPDRKFNLIGIVGVGYTGGFSHQYGPVHYGKTRNISPRVGFAADFRLSDAWKFNVEANGNLDADNFNGIVAGGKYDGRLNMLVGLTYRFPQRGFKVLDAIDPAALQELNNKINEQRKDIDSLQNQLRDQKQQVVEQPVAPAPQKKTMNAIVIFKIGKSVIDSNQKANLYNLANYIKDNNSKVWVVGYADKATGTPAFNQKLSEARVKSVTKTLEDFGVDSSLINTDAKGDSVQPFATENDWNRVAIISQEQ